MKCACPNCHRSLPVQQALPAQVFCPWCGATFFQEAPKPGAAPPTPPPTVAAVPVLATPTPARGIRAAKTAPTTMGAVPAARTAQMHPVAQGHTPPPQSRPSPLVTGAVLGGFALLLLAGGVVAYLCFTAGNSPETARQETPPPKDPSHKPQNGNRDVAPHKDRVTGDRTNKATANRDGEKSVTLPVPDRNKDRKDGTEKDKSGKDKSTLVKPDGPSNKDRTRPPEGVAPLQIKLLETVKKTEKTTPRQLRLAVSEAMFDDMGKLLLELGEGYKFAELNENELLSLKRLKHYDVIFLTCKHSTASKLRQNEALRLFVENGGTLYASDLRFEALRGAFPDYIDPGPNFAGDKQKLTATVVDPGLREVLGDSVTLNFDQRGWKPARFKRNLVKVYMEADYEPDPAFQLKETELSGLLLVKFTCGKGSVIFTSFHNAKQNSEVERKLLKYLVFTAVTSFEETKVTKTMIQGGFSPQPAKRLSIGDEALKATHVYNHPKNGPLQFALGFSNAGAKLKLELVAPDGRKVEREGIASFVVEVDNAAAGDWRYTVTAVSVPYANFPFTLTVGEPVKR